MSLSSYQDYEGLTLAHIIEREMVRGGVLKGQTGAGELVDKSFLCTRIYSLSRSSSSHPVEFDTSLEAVSAQSVSRPGGSTHTMT